MLGLSVARPGAVIALPLVALVAFLPTGNPAGVLVGAAAAILVFTGWGGEGLWFARKGLGDRPKRLVPDTYAEMARDQASSPAQSVRFSVPSLSFPQAFSQIPALGSS